MPPGKNQTSWQPAWNNGKTKTIRVPIVLENEILAYARTVDSQLISDKSQRIPYQHGDSLQEFTLAVIDRYIEYKRQNYHPNQNSRELDISTPAWDELRKFKRMVETSFGSLDSTNVE